MRISRINPTPFKALRISPQLEAWNEDVLYAALDSKKIKEVIKADKKSGHDTFITLEEDSIGTPEGSMYDTMTFAVNGFNDKIELNTQKWIACVQDTTDEKPSCRTHWRSFGPDNLGKNLAKQIADLDAKN